MYCSGGSDLGENFRESISMTLRSSALATLSSSMGSNRFRYPRRRPPFAGSAGGRILWASTLAAPVGDGTDKSSVSDCAVTVFGATGFLGRYVVEQLASIGCQVTVPYRGSDDKVKHLQQHGSLGQIVPVKVDVRDEKSIRAAMATSNVVVNLIGRDYESHSFSYEEVNIGIPWRISRAAKAHGEITRYVHVSALGSSDENPARQYRTKAAGEEITFKNFPEATILRPAHLFGPEDRLLNTWAGFAKKMPVVPIIGTGSSKFQPAHVADVAAAVVTVAQKDDGSSQGRTFELGGPDVYTVNELVSLVFGEIKMEARVLHIPFASAKLFVDQDLFKSIPFPTQKMITFSRNNIKALRSNYHVSWNAFTFNDLGIQPRRIEGAAIEYLHRYRTDVQSTDAKVHGQSRNNSVQRGPLSAPKTVSRQTSKRHE